MVIYNYVVRGPFISYKPLSLLRIYYFVPQQHGGKIMLYLLLVLINVFFLYFFEMERNYCQEIEHIASFPIHVGITCVEIMINLWIVKNSLSHSVQVKSRLHSMKQAVIFNYNFYLRDSISWNEIVNIFIQPLTMSLNFDNKQHSHDSHDGVKVPEEQASKY